MTRINSTLIKLSLFIASLFAKCKIDDFPTPTIQYIADLEKCFHLKLIDHNGKVKTLTK